LEVLITEKQDHYVHAFSSFGSFWGLWCSSFPPECKRYAIELDSTDILTPNMITISSIKKPYIERRGEVTYLNGLVEEIEDDLLFLRFDTDLIMLNLGHAYDYSRYIGQYIQVKLIKLHLYNIGLF
jgi:hypothetical protein